MEGSGSPVTLDDVAAEIARCEALLARDMERVDAGATAASPWRLSAGGAAAGKSVVLLCELRAAAQAPGMHSRAAPPPRAGVRAGAS